MFRVPIFEHTTQIESRSQVGSRPCMFKPLNASFERHPLPQIRVVRLSQLEEAAQEWHPMAASMCLTHSPTLPVAQSPSGRVYDPRSWMRQTPTTA